MIKPRMAIVINLAADMSLGRMIAQACHASLINILQRGEFKNNDYEGEHFILDLNEDKDLKYWLEKSFTKIIFKAWGNDEINNIAKKAKELNIPFSIMTEPDLPGVLTAISIGPSSDKIIEITKDLLLF